MSEVLDLDSANDLRVEAFALVTLGRRSEALAKVHAFVEGIQGRPGASPIDCSHGCSYCCHLPVMLTPAEADELARFVERSPRRAELTAKIEAGYRLVRELDAEALTRSRIPCPLLDGPPLKGSCAVYDARPVACRTFTSGDVSVCRKAYESADDDSPHPARPLDYMTHVMMSAGLAGPERTAFELRTALVERLRGLEPGTLAAVELDVGFEPER
ncbi:MAG: YkgJ family cysteine cluster protein [Deltaproteobacteria bacterium]|nr:YkgJ family cysteine cluster protein [Deltaproteobacteria bacterium]